MSFTGAIDGPAAAGKGTVSKAVAAHFGFAHLDTGLLYRAVGALTLKGTPAIEAAEALVAEDLENPALRTPEVADAASKVAVIPEVRAALVDFQRAFARRAGGAVLDGRDIGTVICPDAEVKFFVTASVDERARRRKAKEVARKSATKKLRLPGKLVDCSATNRDGTELFFVEGDSAGGAAKMARDRKTQALLPLRGKILNVLGAASSKLGSNAEISDLTQALGVGLGTRFNVDDLRYDKIIIMTDADVDGAHIASLLMTFFFTQMRPMIDAGHLYLACPPLFRLTQGAKRVYCLDEAEREAWLEKGLGGKGKIDVSRFKGLGEMDAKDLKETTMDPSSRKLIRVTIDEDEPGETGDLVERLMGKKPEMRFQYIQANAQFVEELDV